jgi:Mg/Co/Ni transporter MgtE
LDIGGVLLQEVHEPTDRIPFVSTQSIQFNDRGKGALRGLTAGAISGALTGFIAGAMLGGICMSSDTPCEDKSLSIGAAGALAGSLIMGGIGAGIGALIGHPTTLTF